MFSQTNSLSPSSSPSDLSTESKTSQKSKLKQPILDSLEMCIQRDEAFPEEKLSLIPQNGDCDLARVIMVNVGYTNTAIKKTIAHLFKKMAEEKNYDYLFHVITTVNSPVFNENIATLAAGSSINSSFQIILENLNNSNIPNKKDFIKDFCSRPNQQGISPIHSAASAGRWDNIKHMLEHDVNIFVESNHKEFPLWTCLDFAVVANKCVTITNLRELFCSSSSLEKLITDTQKKLSDVIKNPAKIAARLNQNSPFYQQNLISNKRKEPPLSSSSLSSSSSSSSSSFPSEAPTKKQKTTHVANNEQSRKKHRYRLNLIPVPADVKSESGTTFKMNHTS